MKAIAGLRAFLAMCLCVVGASAGAETAAGHYPDRPIRLVVPFSAGGPADALGRLLADEWASALHATVVVENKPGAGGNIGTASVARSEPDGYTLLLGYVGPLAINPSLFDKVGFDPLKDFAPIGLLASNPLVLVVNPRLDVDSVPALLKAARSTARALTFGSGGNGSANHLAGEIFAKATGVRLVHVPYKGAAPATAALLGGQVDMMFNGLSVALPHIKAGTLKALAVATPQRVALLPDVQTMEEAGTPGFEVSAWFGLLAPAGTPADVVARLAQAARDALASPTVASRLTASGLVPTPMPPAPFGAFMKSELDRWSDAVRASGARAQ